MQRVAETYVWPLKAQARASGVRAPQGGEGFPNRLLPLREEAPPSGGDAAEKKPYDRAELEKILKNLKIPGG